MHTVTDDDGDTDTDSFNVVISSTPMTSPDTPSGFDAELSGSDDDNIRCDWDDLSSSEWGTGSTSSRQYYIQYASGEYSHR